MAVAKVSKKNQTTTDSTPQIAEFGARLWALFIDCVGLIIIGYLLAIPLGKELAQLGSWGIMVGFLIALIYFGLLNSKLGKGQTLGKRLNNIKVVNQNGEYLSLPRSLGRTLILIAPYFCTGINLPASFLLTPFGAIIDFSFFVFSFGIGTGFIYFYIFNRRTRQSIHDLIAGSFVVSSKLKGAVNPAPVARVHYKFFFIYLLVFILLAAIGILTPNSDNTKRLILQRNLYRIDKVWQTHAVFGAFTESGHRTPFVTVVLTLHEAPADIKRTIQEAAEIVFASYPEIKTKSWLEITVANGYNIGIARSYESVSEKLSPAEWERKLDLPIQ